MKKNIVIWVIALLLAVNTTATAATAAQQHRHTPRTTLVDNKDKQQASADSAAAAQAAAAQANDAVAYSDTTSAAAEDEWENDSQTSAYRQQYRYDVKENQAFAERILDKMVESGYYLVAIVFIVFIGAPLSLLLMIFYLINRNRQDKIRLAEMALKHGQPIPGTERVIYRDSQPREENRTAQGNNTSYGYASPVRETREYTYDEDLRAKGIKHIAIGLGIMICCLAFWNNDFFGGIGFLVACFGGGQLFMARTAKKVETVCQDEKAAGRKANEEPSQNDNGQQNSQELTYPEK